MRRVEPSFWRKRPGACDFADRQQRARESKPLACRLSVVAAVAALLSLASCATPGAVSQKPVAIGKAPYLQTASTPHHLNVSIDLEAAREILSALDRDRPAPGDAAILAALPAVAWQIADSGRGEESFRRDFAQAFQEKPGALVFDLGSVRAERQRWKIVLAACDSDQNAMRQQIAARAAVLLPTDVPVTARLDIYLSFGIAGLADHIVVRQETGHDAIVIDLARALSEQDQFPVEEKIDKIVRMSATELYRECWEIYRRTSPGWKTQSSLGPIDPLARSVAEEGPPALLLFNQDFFPLWKWLKEPMIRSIDQLNRLADRLSDPKIALDDRMEVLAEINRPQFRSQVGSVAGAFMADGIYETFGRQGYLDALAGGPAGFLAAYDRAARQNTALPPLSDAMKGKPRSRKGK
jgi:Putative zinc dependent peptidase (DUF5700)